jgi:tetratricopeptide (TPR) repeat protein
MAAHREDGHVQYSPPLPFVHSPYFTGCENFLACLHARLQNGWATGSNCAEAISGLPGIGKTRIAIEYAIKLKNSYDLVYWCSAESRDALSGSYVKLAQLLELPESKEDHESAITAVVKWLSTSSVKWLLVLDNLDVEIPYELPTSSNTNLQPMQFFSGFLPQEFTGDILITTRAHILPGAIHTIQVPLMDIHNGTLFLLRRSGRIPKQGTLTTVLNSEDIKHAKDLVIETGGLPLALNQLGAWVQQTGSLVDCLEVFQTQKKRLLEKNVLQDCHPLSVIVVFEMCLKKAMDRLSYDNLHVSAQQFLWLLAFLHGDGILVSMLRDGVLYLNEPLKALIDNLYNLGVVVMVLDSYSLILRDEKELSIHRLVQHVIQDQIPDPIHWAELAVQIVSNVFPKVNYGTLDGPLPYLLHAEICVSNIKKHEIRIQEAGNLAFACGQYYYYAGLYQQAMQYYETALCILKENQRFVPTDNQHISVSFILCAKAQIFWRQGLYVQAIEFYQSALDTCQNQLGTEHYETAPILHQFARTLGEHGEYVKCEDMFGQALRIIKRKMGSEDKMTARTEHEFARILGEQQKFSQAEALSQHALEIFRKVEGICHPSTASVDRALCRIKFEQGKFDYCEETLWWCLDIMVKNMGPSHLETGTTFHELASLYYKQNRFTEAEKYYMESLAIYDKLCPGHPDTAETLYRLASLCQMEGKYEEATGYYAKVMEIRKAQLSAGHIQTLKAKQAYIALLQDMGQNEDAKQLEEASDSFDL